MRNHSNTFDQSEIDPKSSKLIIKHLLEICRQLEIGFYQFNRYYMKLFALLEM